MPIRIRSKGAQSSERDPSPISYGPGYADLPDIAEDDAFRDVIKKLSMFVATSRQCPHIRSLTGPQVFHRSHCNAQHFRAIEDDISRRQLKNSGESPGRQLQKSSHCECPPVCSFVSLGLASEEVALRITAAEVGWKVVLYPYKVNRPDATNCRQSN
jgi:hypothetical protein